MIIYGSANLLPEIFPVCYPLDEVITNEQGNGNDKHKRYEIRQ